MGSTSLNVTTVEQALPILRDGIDKIIDMVESHTKITPELYMNTYTIVYNICQSNQNNGPECQKLYDIYNQVLEDYISSKVLPCLVGKEDENLLQEVITRWDSHKLVTNWISKSFIFLNRYYICRKSLPDLQESSYSIFHKLVLVGSNVQNLVMHMIERIRSKEEINDQSLQLLKNTINMYLKIGMDYYRMDIEKNILKHTHKFYFPKAFEWIKSMEYGDYMTEVEGCIRIEEDCIALYLEETTRKKLLKSVNYELLEFYEDELEEKKSIHLEAVYMQILYMKIHEEQEEQGKQEQDIMCSN